MRHLITERMPWRRSWRYTSWCVLAFWGRSHQKETYTTDEGEMGCKRPPTLEQAKSFPQPRAPLRLTAATFPQHFLFFWSCGGRGPANPGAKGSGVLQARASRVQPKNTERGRLMVGLPGTPCARKQGVGFANADSTCQSRIRLSSSGHVSHMVLWDELSLVGGERSNQCAELDRQNPNLQPPKRVCMAISVALRSTCQPARIAGFLQKVKVGRRIYAMTWKPSRLNDGEKFTGETPRGEMCLELALF